MRLKTTGLIVATCEFALVRRDEQGERPDGPSNQRVGTVPKSGPPTAHMARYCFLV